MENAQDLKQTKDGWTFKHGAVVYGPYPFMTTAIIAKESLRNLAVQMQVGKGVAYETNLER